MFTPALSDLLFRSTTRDVWKLIAFRRYLIRSQIGCVLFNVLIVTERIALSQLYIKNEQVSTGKLGRKLS